MKKVIGYGRVSMSTQDNSTQKMLIEQALGLPVDEWYEDHGVSGTTKAASRPNFKKMIDSADKNTTIVFSRVDRIGRKTIDILTTVEDLVSRGVEVYILQIGKVPLNTSQGMLQLTVYAMFAENERLVISERTRDSLANKKLQGVVLGGKAMIPPDTLKAICEDRETHTLDQLSSKYGYNRMTIQRNVKKWSSSLEGYSNRWSEREIQRC